MRSVPRRWYLARCAAAAFKTGRNFKMENTLLRIGCADIWSISGRRVRETSKREAMKNYYERLWTACCRMELRDIVDSLTGGYDICDLYVFPEFSFSGVPRQSPVMGKKTVLPYGQRQFRRWQEQSGPGSGVDQHPGAAERL